MKNAMDITAVQGLGSICDNEAIARTMTYFTALKESAAGWQICLKTLLEQTIDDHTKFFCLQVLEHWLKASYSNASPNDRQMFKDGIVKFVKTMCSRCDGKEKAFVKNKLAQILCILCLCDYPHQWPSYFTDLLHILNLGADAVDLYLRVLLAIDAEIVERDLTHDSNTSSRNTVIKDSMRGGEAGCVPALVESWCEICGRCEQQDGAVQEVVCLTLQVMGKYSSWIDISYVANERVVDLLLRCLHVTSLREACCDCISMIVHKGMEPVAKTKLVQSFYSVLQSARVFDVVTGQGQCNGQGGSGQEQGDDADIDFIIKLSELVNSFGLELAQSWQKLIRQKDHINASDVLVVIDSLVPLMLSFLSHEDDDVSKSITDFSAQYIFILKQIPMINATQRNHITAMIQDVICKFKYVDYNFDKEGEDEEDFQVYRHELKTVFNNLVLLASDQVACVMCDTARRVFERWKSQGSPTSITSDHFSDVEVTLFLFHHIGEVIPIMNSCKDPSQPAHKLINILHWIFEYRVFEFAHPVIGELFFEIVVRYDKYFSMSPQPTYLMYTLRTFISRLSEPAWRGSGRLAYLLGRFVRGGSVRGLLQPYAGDMLSRLQHLLLLSPACHPPAAATPLTPALTCDDLQALYEVAAVLVLAVNCDPQEKCRMMSNLLEPVVTKFNEILDIAVKETDNDKIEGYVEALNTIISYASYSSKAFSNKQLSMSCCGCVALYCGMLEVFLRALQQTGGGVRVSAGVQSGVRQYLHRMLVCVEERHVLPYLPVALENMLATASGPRAMHDIIPLINQIISKFRKSVIPFMQSVFVYVVDGVIGMLSQSFDESDQQVALERQMLQRSYYLFISTILVYDVPQVMSDNPNTQKVEQVLVTVVQGAANVTNAAIQKTCFGILSKMIDVWGGASISCNNAAVSTRHQPLAPQGFSSNFITFLYERIVPACFMVPLQEGFDLQDGQTVLTLNECAACLRSAYQKRGEECVLYLQSRYLPSLNLSPSIIQEFCAALRSDKKIFQTYLKTFVSQLRSSATATAAAASVT